MRRLVLLVLSVLLTALVFSMSLSVGTASAALSSPVTAVVERILSALFPRYAIPFDALHAIVRKLAHMAEYAALGILYLFTARAWNRRAWPVFAAGVLVAIIDEGIQAFVPGRGPSIVDALLFDFPGFALGAAAAILAGRWRGRCDTVSKDVS